MSAISDLVGRIRSAFFGKQMADAFGVKPSKKHKPGSIETGPDAAQKYRHKKKLHAGHGSSLKKLQREFRIEAGLRPLKFDVPGKREAKIVARAAARVHSGNLPAPHPMPDEVRALFAGRSRKSEADALKGTNLRPLVPEDVQAALDSKLLKQPA